MWQDEYKAKFTDEQKRKVEIDQLTREIKQADKRTHNGKMTKIFNTAKILALQKI
jgi:hypothetical protein